MKRKEDYIKMRIITKSKKGFMAFEVILMIVFLTIFAIGIVVFKFVLSDVRSDVDADADMDPMAVGVIDQYDNSYAETYDNLFVFTFFLFLILVIISSAFIDTHPLFAFIIIILIIPIVFIGMALSNLHEDIAGGEFPAEYAQFPKTAQIMDYLPHIALITLVLSGLAMFAKRRFVG